MAPCLGQKSKDEGRRDIEDTGGNVLNDEEEEQERFVTVFRSVQPIDSRVRLKGSWDNFRKAVVMRPVHSRDLKSEYEASLSLLAGKHLYQYYVNGKVADASVQVEEVNSTRYNVVMVPVDIENPETLQPTRSSRRKAGLLRILSKKDNKS
mmetsp:Transcript_405/g.1387  ORF Transcript_405/g.1387 Transcript_405/m.1387 type:complete len:151 (-) Transcript_405:95-547(-)